MTETTPIDDAHALMQAAPDDATARLRLFERVADSELFLMLTEEAQGETLSPELFDLDEGRFVLAFDTVERLARFAGRPAPYAALSGRVLAQMLAGQGIGLGLNLDVAPSAVLIPAEGMAWLAELLETAPAEIEARIAALAPPEGLPEALFSALGAKLAAAGGLAKTAWLVGVTYRDGGRGHLLAFVDAVSRARPALAKAAGEALAFSGLETGVLDVGFFSSDDAIVGRLAAVGRGFDLPQPPRPQTEAPAAPGSDPDKPPILR